MQFVFSVLSTLAGAGVGAFIATQPNDTKIVIQKPQANPSATQNLGAQIAPQINTGGAKSQLAANFTPVNTSNVTIVVNAATGSHDTIDPVVKMSHRTTMDYQYQQTPSTNKSSPAGPTLVVSGVTKSDAKPTPHASDGSGNQPAAYSSFYSAYVPQPRHPLKIIAASGLAGTLGTLYFVHSTECMFQGKDRWCNWRGEIPTKDLSENLATELIVDIQRRYTTTKNAHDFIEPLQIFINALEDERTALNRYLSLSSFLDRIYIGKIFGINDLSISNAKNRLERANAIRDIFIAWTAEYKLGRRPH